MMGTDRFINPYNFVPSDLKRKYKHDLSRESGLHTGVLTCRLITRTPLAVPDTSRVRNKKIGPKETDIHKIYPFFDYGDGVPVIPGSTLRGAFRSVYETVTDSCYATMNEDELITSRSNQAFLPGILVRDKAGNWTLHKAVRYLLKVREYVPFDQDNGNCAEITRKELEGYGLGTKVYFKVPGKEPLSYKRSGKYVSSFHTGEKREGEKAGYLFCGEPFVKKHFESIFAAQKEVVPAPQIEKSLQRLEETVRVYNNEKINRNLGPGAKGHHGYAGFQAALKKGILPVWYRNPEPEQKRPGQKRTDPKAQTAQEPVYLSMASLGRMAYHKSMGDLLEEKKPCASRDDLCSACALFGMASKESLGGRVRFTDARAVNWSEDSMEKGVILRELASPKPSYLPFYTETPPAGEISRWSYDHNTKIRGRKFYWHSDSDYYKTEEDNLKKQPVRITKRNNTMDLVKADTEFTFQVFYDHITEEQLKELLWVLTLGENDAESRRCHKVGHGKPLGLGSVKVLVQTRAERACSQGYGFSVQTVGQVEDPFAGRNTRREQYKNLLRILTLDAASAAAVEYPRVIPGEAARRELERTGGTTLNNNKYASHQWFSQNYKLGATSVKQPLPAIGSQKLAMDSLKAGE